MKNLIFKNWPVKIICLSAASLLWFYVASGQQMIAKFPGTIKIRAVNVTAGLIPIFDEKSTEIRIMAQQSDWQKLSPDAFAATVDLSGLTAGTHEIAVNVTALSPGVSVVDKKPSKILVTLDPIITKEVPITKKIEGNAAEGMVAGNVEFNPAKVTIKGAKTLLENIDEATGTIVLSGQNSNFSAKINVAVADAAGQAISDIEVTPGSAGATINIVKGSNVKSLGIKPKITGRVQSGYFINNIAVTPSVLEVTGPRNLVNELTYIETAGIDVDGLSANIEKDVALQIPDNLTILGNGGTRAKVSVQISPLIVSQQYTLSTFDIADFNKQVLSLNPKEIKVTLSGPVETIRSFDSTKLSPKFSVTDLAKIDDRSYLLNISSSQFALPEGLSVVSIEPSTLVINTN